MDDFGGRREGPIVGPERGENQHCNVGIEATKEGHEYQRTIKRHVGDEDPAEGIQDNADQQESKTGPIRTSLEERNINNC